MFITLTTGLDVKLRINVDQIIHYYDFRQDNTKTRLFTTRGEHLLIESVEDIDKMLEACYLFVKR